ncbi:MAG: DapH/DapD/GlmU-related protein [Patescibacteria group bacterium]
MAILKSHGTGKFKRGDFRKIGKNVIIEPEVLVFHPENIEIGDNVYLGHRTILKAYYKNKMIIKDNVWIGQNCFLHSAGGIIIGPRVGVAPGVMMLGSPHDLSQDNLGPINELPLIYKPIEIEEGCDIGIGAIILGGVIVRRGTQVGAGAVVAKSTRPFSIFAGVPAKFLRRRKKTSKKQDKNTYEKIN